MGGNHHSRPVWGFALASDAYSNSMAHGLQRFSLVCGWRKLWGPSLDSLRGRFIGPGSMFGSKVLRELFIKRHNLDSSRIFLQVWNMGVSTKARSCCKLGPRSAVFMRK